MFELANIVAEIKKITFLEYIVFFITAFFLFRFLISFINFIYRPLHKFNFFSKDITVSVLIPARNEENNLPAILNDLKLQTYKKLEIIIYNDKSTDNTLKIAQNLKKTDSRIKIINGKDLPKNWLGKNFACYNLAKNATGKYLIFIDADVRLKPKLIEKTLWFVHKKNLALLSIFPYQVTKTFSEKITVPIMNFILLTLLALPSLAFRYLFKSLSAANGQFMFFNAKIYKKFNPHFLMKNKKAEDISIARFYKKKRQKIRCLANLNEISCRMYTSYNEAVNGFSKNVVNMLGGNYLFAFLFFLFSAFGLLFLAFTNYKLFFISLLFNILSHFFVSNITNKNFFENILLSFIQVPVLAHILALSVIKKIKKQNKWKGRNIYS